MVTEVRSQGLWHSKQDVRPISEQHPALIHFLFHMLCLDTQRWQPWQAGVILHIPIKQAIIGRKQGKINLVWPQWEEGQTKGSYDTPPKTVCRVLRYGCMV